MKRAAEAEGGDSEGPKVPRTSHKCEQCGAEFTSRNKLFKHLRGSTCGKAEQATAAGFQGGKSF